MKHHLKLLLVLSGMLSGAVAAAGQLSGPTLGYVWSSNDRQLHPIFGISGSATIGNAKDLGFPVSQALALGGRHFLTSTDANPSIFFVSLAASATSITAIVEATSNPSGAVGSRTGTAAALYYAAQQRILIVTGLPAIPKVAHRVDISGDAISRMTVSDDGSLLLYAVRQGTSEALYGWTPYSGSRQLTTAESISAIALTPRGDAIVADARANEIFSIANPKGAAARTFLADDRSGVAKPTNVMVSNSGNLYVTNGRSDTILVLDSAGQLLRTHHCGCELAGLFRLTDSLYALSDRTDRTLYLLEVGTTADRIVFVPPGRKNQ